MHFRTFVWCFCFLKMVVGAMESKRQAPPAPPGGQNKPIPEQYKVDVAYNAQQEKCCRGKIHPLTNPRALQKCCGSDSYDKSRQLCCDGVVKDRKPGMACCGQDTFNSDEELCCYGTVVPASPDAIKAGTARCCGRSALDSTTQICCSVNGEQQAVTKEDADSDGCCGDTPYNTKTQACCLGEENDTPTTQVLPFEGNKTKCCGEALFDPSSNDVCCGGEIYKENATCCNGKPYHKSEELCCSGEVLPNQSGGLKCCGPKETYDPSTELCCTNSSQDGGPVKTLKTDPEQDSCCGSQPFNTNTQLCCVSLKGVEYLATKRTPNANLCCGEVAYEIDKGVCCNGNFFEGPLYQLGCCGELAFNITTGQQFCCNDKLEKRRPGLECCGISQLHDPSKEMCCVDFMKNPRASKVHPKEKGKFCCGTELFNIATELCCEDVVFEKGENQNCCGAQAYDGDTQACCLGQPVTKQKGQNACCYHGFTDEVQLPWLRNPSYGFIP